MSGVICDQAAYSQDFPEFAKPIFVGHFSKHVNGTISFDKSQLKILDKQTLESRDVSFDLSEGFDRLVEKPQERLDNLLRWILHHRKQCLMNGNHVRCLKDILHNADFVCWRGILTRIASTLYKPNEGWIICVCKVQDVYFLCEFYTALKEEQLKNQSERNKLMTFWGHRFEHYVTLDETASESTAAADVNLNEEFCYIFRSKLDGCHRLIFGAEIDAVDPNTSSLVELKTNIRIETERQRKNFERYKSVSWWLQSFLVGVDQIICGYRDNDGMVMSVRQVALTEILKQGQKHWSGSKCFNFLSRFLAFIKQSVAANNASLVYKFEYNPETRSINFDVDLDKEHAFLPDWFLKEVVN